MNESPYARLAGLSASIERLAEAGEWDRCAALTVEMLGLLKSGMPNARPADRASITAALESIAAIEERAMPLHEDITRLLKAFGT